MFSVIFFPVSSVASFFFFLNRNKQWIRISVEIKTEFLKNKSLTKGHLDTWRRVLLVASCCIFPTMHIESVFSFFHRLNEKKGKQLMMKINALTKKKYPNDAHSESLCHGSFGRNTMMVQDIQQQCIVAKILLLVYGKCSKYLHVLLLLPKWLSFPGCFVIYAMWCFYISSTVFASSQTFIILWYSIYLPFSFFASRITYNFGFIYRNKRVLKSKKEEEKIWWATA